MNTGKFVSAQIAESGQWCYGVLKRRLKGARMEVVTMRSNGNVGETVVCLQSNYRVCRDTPLVSVKVVGRFLGEVRKQLKPPRGGDAMMRTVPGSYGTAR
jgi:hypothetical protein